MNKHLNEAMSSIPQFKIELKMIDRIEMLCFKETRKILCYVRNLIYCIIVTNLPPVVVLTMLSTIEKALFPSGMNLSLSHFWQNVMNVF